MDSYMAMKGRAEQAEALLTDALPYIERASTHWRDGAPESHNLRDQAAAQDLVDRIRAAIAPEEPEIPYHLLDRSKERLRKLRGEDV